jgi:hypothetical protein
MGSPNVTQQVNSKLTLGLPLVTGWFFLLRIAQESDFLKKRQGKNSGPRALSGLSIWEQPALSGAGEAAHT